MAETVLEGNHKNHSRPEVHGDSRPRISPYTHLPSPKRTAAGREFKHIPDQRSVRKEQRTPTRTPHALLSALSYLWPAASYLCCVAVVAAFPQPQSASSSFYISSMHDGELFFCGRCHFDCWLLRSRRRQQLGLVSACLDL